MSAERGLLQLLVDRWNEGYTLSETMKAAEEVLNNTLQAMTGNNDAKEIEQLRDHFAGLAMQGIIQTTDNLPPFKLLAETSYDITDEMVKERSKVYE